MDAPPRSALWNAGLGKAGTACVPLPVPAHAASANVSTRGSVLRMKPSLVALGRELYAQMWPDGTSDPNRVLTAHAEWPAFESLRSQLRRVVGPICRAIRAHCLRCGAIRLYERPAQQM